MQKALSCLVRIMLAALIGAMLLFAVFRLTHPIHHCLDATHVLCDGECECDGFNCN